MYPTRRPSIALLTTAALVAAPAAALAAHGGDYGPGQSGKTPKSPAPLSIALPNGFQPEGIASGPGHQLYVGSIPTGAVYRADPRTGEGAVLVAGKTGRAAIGLKVTGRKIVVAGGSTGRAFVYDARTGADLAEVTLTTGTTFVNDVAVAGRAAYFTDSQQPQLYRLGLGGKGKGKKSGTGNKGAVATSATTIPITGDLKYDADPSTFEANGIVALRGGRELLVVQSGAGKLFRVNASSGVSVEVPLTGGNLMNGDGMLLKGKTLYVVQNRLNQIAVVKLSKGATAGAIQRAITNPAFRVPSTIARQGRDLFAVNARFGTAPTPATDYDVTRVSAK